MVVTSVLALSIIFILVMVVANLHFDICVCISDGVGQQSIGADQNGS
jgi:hypothetical protein